MRDDLSSRIRELYEQDGLSTRKIAELLQIGRRRVDRALRAAGVAVAPRGAGRPRPATRHTDQDDLQDRLRELYTDLRLTRREISEKLGLTEGLVRSRLAEYGISTRTLRRAGIPLRAPGGRSPFRRRWEARQSR